MNATKYTEFEFALVTGQFIKITALDFDSAKADLDEAYSNAEILYWQFA